MFYGAFLWGKTVTTSFNPISSTYIAEREVKAYRAGIGRTDKVIVAASVVAGNALSDINRDSIRLPGGTGQNFVVGFDVTYKPRTGTELGLEYARSASPFVGEAQNEQRSVLDMKDRFSEAFNAFFRTTLISSGTRVSFYTKVVGPNYYSYAAPNLRQDNFRVEGLVEQPFLKGRLITLIRYLQDQDNLYDQKAATFTNRTLLSALSCRIGKNFAINVTAGPSFQQMFFTTSNSSSTTSLLLYSGSVSYNSYSTRRYFSASINYSYNTSEVEGTEVPGFTSAQYGGNVLWQERGCGLKISGSLSSSMYDGSVVYGRNLMSSTRVSIPLLKRCEAGIGYAYLWHTSYQERHVAKVDVQVSLPFSIAGIISCERHHALMFKESNRTTILHIGRISIIKRFSL
jgi:hypothetical protein